MVTITSPGIPAGGPAPASQPAPVATRPGAVRGFLRETGDLVVFVGQALRALPGSARYFSEALRQASMMLRGTMVLMFVMHVFLGISVTNFAFVFLRSIGASDYLGVISGFDGPRQLVPSMFGYVFTGKICCGIAAELGAMRIQQEIDALETTGVDPLRYLVGTRLLGVLLFVPVACVVSLIAVLCGVYLTSVTVYHGIAPNVLLDVNWSVQTVQDQLVTMINVSAMAIITAIVACFYGLRTRGGPAAVGTSVARSLTVNLVLVHVIAVFFAVLFYGTDLNLPIGG